MLTTAAAHDGDANVIHWSRREPFLLSGGDDGALKVWDLRQFKVPSHCIPRAGEAPVPAAAGTRGLSLRGRLRAPEPGKVLCGGASPWGAGRETGSAREWLVWRRSLGQPGRWQEAETTIPSARAGRRAAAGCWGLEGPGGCHFPFPGFCGTTRDWSPAHRLREEAETQQGRAPACCGPSGLCRPRGLGRVLLLPGPSERSPGFPGLRAFPGSPGGDLFPLRCDGLHGISQGRCLARSRGRVDSASRAGSHLSELGGPVPTAPSFRESIFTPGAAASGAREPCPAPRGPRLSGGALVEPHASASPPPRPPEGILYR